jgi:hypothetical protein
MFSLGAISSRNEFGKLLNDRGLIKVAVEVGTHRGVFARILLKKWKGQMLYCIDPWEVLPGYEYQAKFLDGGNESREGDYKECLKNLKEFDGRYLLSRSTSPRESEQFEDKSVSFVYLDGDHSYKAVLADLKAWWPKVRTGGILAGHDIIMPGSTDDNWGDNIQHALYDVFPFNVIIHLVAEEGNLPWSYYIIKES